MISARIALLAFCLNSASAATITKVYSFSGSGEGFTTTDGSTVQFTAQINGAFTYEIPAVGTPSFKSFKVTPTSSKPDFFDELEFDLTSYANNPTINGTGPSCTALNVGARATLLLMTTCADSQTSTAKALWILTFTNTTPPAPITTMFFGFPYSSGFSTTLNQNSIYFGFQENPPPVIAQSVNTLRIVSWTTTLESETTGGPEIPEPSTFLLIPAAAIFVLRTKLR